jgi:signal transduction histidine kinase
MVYACVQRHRGTIALKTAPGEGATFTITLAAST